MDKLNNLEAIRLLKEKKEACPGEDFLVRVSIYDPLSCADFDYIPVSELISKLENNEIAIRPEELGTYISIN